MPGRRSVQGKLVKEYMALLGRIIEYRLAQIEIRALEHSGVIAEIQADSGKLPAVLLQKQDMGSFPIFGG